MFLLCLWQMAWIALLPEPCGVPQAICSQPEMFLLQLPFITWFVAKWQLGDINFFLWNAL